MPLTSDLTQLTSTGNIEKMLESPTYFDLPSRTFYLDGCIDYMSSIQNSLTMFKMKNKGHVMDTDTFKVYLWALDDSGNAYPIAKKESGIIFPQSSFTTGSISKFTLTPVESTEVQNHTRYNLKVWPVHDIPTSSKITF